MPPIAMETKGLPAKNTILRPSVLAGETVLKRMACRLLGMDYNAFSACTCFVRRRGVSTRKDLTALNGVF